MKGAIQSLISKGAISVVNPCPQLFISTLFLVEKEQGTGGPEFRPKEEFKMKGLHTACSFLLKGDYMLKTRPEGRLLCSPDTPGVEEISSFPVQARENNGTEREARGVGQDMSCPLKLFLTQRKSRFSGVSLFSETSKCSLA